METKRRKFQGVLNILSFNRHFYYYGLSFLGLIIVSQLLLGWSTMVLWIIVAGFTYGLLMPLLVSAYVYDYSGYYNLKWLDTLGLKNSTSQNLVNINAGFDETSFLIKDKYPLSHLQVFDFYNSKQHTEPAIIRARKVSLVYPNTLTNETNAIPIKDNSIDAVFLLSAAHEIRSNDEKVQFLKECLRICKPNGKVIMVEHLRDLPNFFAFTVGSTHFFSRKTWKKAFKNAGFTKSNETKFTPFMSIFQFES